MNIGDSLQKTGDSFFGFLPNLLGCLVLILIGYIVARIVAGLVRKATEKARLDRRLAETGSGRAMENAMPGASAARLIGLVIFWLVFGFFLVAAAGALHIAAVTDFMNRVLAYLPNVVAAVAPALIMVLAMFMILEQLRIAQQIVAIAFAATMGALALGLALAFGLGGRPVAQRLLEDAYAKGRSDATWTRTGTSATSTGPVPDPRMAETDTQAMSRNRMTSATYREEPRPEDL